MHIELLATDNKLVLDRSGMYTTIHACIQCQMYRTMFASVTMHAGLSYYKWFPPKVVPLDHLCIAEYLVSLDHP